MKVFKWTLRRQKALFKILLTQHSGSLIPNYIFFQSYQHKETKERRERNGEINDT